MQSSWPVRPAPSRPLRCPSGVPGPSDCLTYWAIPAVFDPVPRAVWRSLTTWVPSCGDGGFCEMITWRMTAVLFLFGIV